MTNNEFAIESFISFCDEMEIAEEKLETNILDGTLSRSMYLYHASYLKLNIIKPTSLNMGTRLSTRRMSSFWTSSLEYSLVWVLDWVCAAIGIDTIHDIERKKMYFPDIRGRLRTDNPSGEFKHISEIIKETLRKKPLYIHGAEIPMKYIGRGQVPIDEYSVDISVTPDKIIEINDKNVFSFNVIEFVSVDEYKKMVDSRKGIYQKDKLNLREKLIFRNPRRTLRKRSDLYRSGKVDTTYYPEEI